MSPGDPESRAMNVALVVTMSPVVVATLLQGDTFGAGSTLSLVLGALGLIGLVSKRPATPAIPRAQARRSSLRGTR